jgi:hypothetical protein
MIRLSAVLVLLPVSTIDLGFLRGLPDGNRLRPELVSIQELVLELDSELLELADEVKLLEACKLKPELELVSKRSLVRLLVRELLLELFLKENIVIW